MAAMQFLQIFLVQVARPVNNLSSPGSDVTPRLMAAKQRAMHMHRPSFQFARESATDRRVYVHRQQLAVLHQL